MRASREDIYCRNLEFRDLDLTDIRAGPLLQVLICHFTFRAYY